MSNQHRKDKQRCFAEPDSDLVLALQREPERPRVFAVTPKTLPISPKGFQPSLRIATLPLIFSLP